MILFIIFLNLITFICWHLYPGFMELNFLVSWNALSEGRYWTLITSVFSHNMLWHFLINMLVLNSFGPIVRRVIGTRSFLLFYFVAGIVSSLSHCLVSAFLMDQPEMNALGASGAVAGLVLLFSMLFPKEKILLFAIIPMPAMVGALAFIGLDIWGLMSQVQGGGLPIGHGAHLGGAFVGIIYYFFFLRGWWLKSKTRQAMLDGFD